MNKNEFISELHNSLKGIGVGDKMEIIYDYEEYFREGIEHGKAEEEIAEALGDPKVIAGQFTSKSTNRPAADPVAVILRSIGMGFLNLIMLPFIISAACLVFSLALACACAVISFVIGYASVLISFYAAAAGMTLGGVGIILCIFIRPIIPDYITIDINYGSAILLAVGVFCLGILAFIGAVKISGSSVNCCKKLLISTYNATQNIIIGFYNWILKYIKMNVSIVIKEKGE